MNHRTILKSMSKTTLPVLLMLLAFVSCKRETETFQTEALSNLIPLEIGKYIIYRLDSTVFINSGKVEAVHKYQVKHLVSLKTVDNLDRPTWRVDVYINDSLASGPWTPSSYYFVTPLPDQTEVIENNLRVIKLHLPVKELFTWRGNSYLPDRPYAALYATNIDQNMDIWDFTYDQLDQTETIGGKSVPNVTTVTHVDESRNVPMTTDTIYASREYSMEKYAKNIGLVYKEHVLWENQPRQRTTGNPPNIVVTYDPIRVGFGVKMWMISKN